MVTLWNRNASRTVIDLRSALDGPPTEPPVRKPDPCPLELRAEQRQTHWVLTVENRGDSLARHVVVRTVAPVGLGAPPSIVADRGEPVHLRPFESVEHQLLLAEEHARGARYQISWRDGHGQHIAYQDVLLLAPAR